MADIRIKDLTSPASSTASDDFFAVDGTTNGTRKLNAFSPTFGGNATVTGTLTVSGALSSTSSTNDYGWSVTGSGIGGPYITLDATNATTGNRFTGLLLKNNGTLQWVAQLRAGDGNFHIYDAVRSVSTLTIAPGALNGVAGTSTFAGAVAITSTSASTTTSSGALVVSGGVGVAGAIFSGGYIHAGGDSDFYLRGAGAGNGLLRGNYVSADVDGAFRIRNAAGSTIYVEVASTGLIAAIPATAPSLTVNGTMTFERTSNTSLKISVRGTDGTTRSVSLTLA